MADREAGGEMKIRVESREVSEQLVKLPARTMNISLVTLRSFPTQTGAQKNKETDRQTDTSLHSPNPLTPHGYLSQASSPCPTFHKAWADRRSSPCLTALPSSTSRSLIHTTQAGRARREYSLKLACLCRLHAANQSFDLIFILLREELAVPAMAVS